jgi:hypothetical protein
MQQRIDFNQFFTNIDCSLVIFLEDDFSLPSASDIDKSKLLYGLSRMEIESRERLFTETQELYPDLVISLRDFCRCMDSSFELISNWNEEVIRDDIISSLDFIKIKSPGQYEELMSIYNSFDLPDNLTELMPVLLKYGLCLNIPPLYQNIFDEYLFLKSRWKPVRIYSSFNADDSKSFSSELKMFFEKNSDNACVCCIIDNELAGERRASAIIEEIRSFNGDKRNFIIGAVVTSHETTEKIDEHIFLEYVNKSLAQNMLQSALLRSAYNYAIYKLKDEMVNGLNTAFSRATVDRNIAFYLSQMAVFEGVANYQIINEWINTMCDFELSKSKALSNIVKVTNLINQIDEEDYVIAEDLNMLNTFEAFDYNVNVFHQPPAAGDVFIDEEDKVYILVGQDCDIIMSETRKRRNALSELIPAEIVLQTEMYKVKNNLNHMMLNNFKKDADASLSCLKIDYTKRVFLENEILDLCTYNKEGFCRIDIKEELNGDAIKIMMPYLVNHYQRLQKYYTSVKTLKIQAGEALDEFLDVTHALRLFPVHKYEEISENQFSYPLRRVCRLTKTYVLYLYKLYLEHRGRQPYNSINLARSQTLDIPISDSKIDGEVSVQVILSGDRKINSRPAKLPWEVSKTELLKLLTRLGADPKLVENKDSFVFESITTDIELKDGKVLKVTKSNKPTIKLELTRK